MRKLNTQEFIEKARSVHGDKYDYSLSHYRSARGIVKIICPVHGVFEQEAYSHAAGRGCIDCAGTRKKTTADFIKEARQVHGDKYDYSTSNYLSANKKIEIICPRHGSFHQTPASHLKQGTGCPACAGNKKRDTSSFIEDARKVHGDKYDYSLSDYINDGSKDGTKIKIICPVHGVFEQRASSHLLGMGCFDCGIVNTSQKRRKTRDQFIEEARNVHGDKYDYSKVKYINDTSKVKIICPTHGEFWQGAGKHLSGQGCISCHRIEQSLSQKDSKDMFIQKARLVHGEKYDYSKSDYQVSAVKVEIICPDHGSFWQTPNTHISKGSGCPRCISPRAGYTTEEFIKEAIAVHGDENYDYSQVDYQGIEIPVKIICPSHGEFWQAPWNHLKGHKCKNCAESGFDTSKPSIIYFLKFKTPIAAFWKIGITNRTIESRFGRQDGQFIESGYQWQCIGKTAYEIEQELLNKYQPYKLNYLFPLLQKKGDTECFSLDLPVKKIVKTITQKLQNPPEVIKGGLQ